MGIGWSDWVEPSDDSYNSSALSSFDRAVDLAQGAADEQQEQTHEHDDAGDQRGGEPQELLLRGARVLLQRLEPRVRRRAHPARDGARRVGQHAEALVNRRFRGARAEHSVHVFRDRREPCELIADRRIARQHAHLAHAFVERRLVGVVRVERILRGRSRSHALDLHVTARVALHAAEQIR